MVMLHASDAHSLIAVENQAVVNGDIIAIKSKTSLFDSEVSLNAFLAKQVFIVERAVCVRNEGAGG